MHVMRISTDYSNTSSKGAFEKTVQHGTLYEQTRLDGLLDGSIASSILYQLSDAAGQTFETTC